MDFKLISVSIENHELLKRISEKITADLDNDVTINTLANEVFDELFNSNKYDNFFHILKNKIKEKKRKRVLLKILKNKSTAKLFKKDIGRDK